MTKKALDANELNRRRLDWIPEASINYASIILGMMLYSKH